MRIECMPFEHWNWSSILSVCTRFASRKRARSTPISLCSSQENVRWERVFSNLEILNYLAKTSYLKSRLNFEFAGFWMTPNGLPVIEIWPFKTRVLFLKLARDIPASKKNKMQQRSKGKCMLSAHVLNPEISSSLLSVCTRFPSNKRVHHAPIFLC